VAAAPRCYRQRPRRSRSSPLHLHHTAPSQWKSARTTETLEQLHQEFERRIKMQTVLTSRRNGRHAVVGCCVRADHHAEKLTAGTRDCTGDRAGHSNHIRNATRVRNRMRQSPRPPSQYTSHQLHANSDSISYSLCEGAGADGFAPPNCTIKKGHDPVRLFALEGPCSMLYVLLRIQRVRKT
jgi:hypothetical protein